MLIRCTHCGYQNNEHYRFCGSCGAILQIPGPPPAAPSTSAASARLQEPRARSLDYLLEDEPEKGHGRMYAALVLLLIAGIVVAWQWHAQGYPWPQRTPGSSTASEAPTDPGAAAKPAETATQPTPPPAAQPPAAESQSPAMTAADGAQSATSPQESPQQPAAAAPSAAPDSTGETNSTKQIDGAKAEGAAPPPESDVPNAGTAPTGTKPAATPKPSSAAAAPAAPVLTYEDKLAAVGEKYLYGTGVRPNCAVAQKNLRAAAQRSNPKAQSILGTMYATGHCVERDLPMAYRWFARALRQDPNNDRIQRDLVVLWRQMTPGERQLAMRQ